MAMVVSGLLKDDSITPVTLSKYTECWKAQEQGGITLKVPSLYLIKK